MKKLFSLLVIVLLAAGCNKQKNVPKDFTGTWRLYKYLLQSVDVTQQFEKQYGSYTITFTGNTFTRTLAGPDTVSNSGTFQLTDNNQQLILSYTTYSLVDSVNVATPRQEQYNLFDVTSVSMELFTDSSVLYLDTISQH